MKEYLLGATIGAPLGTAAALGIFMWAANSDFVVERAVSFLKTPDVQTHIQNVTNLSSGDSVLAFSAFMGAVMGMLFVSCAKESSRPAGSSY